MFVVKDAGDDTRCASADELRLILKRDYRERTVKVEWAHSKGEAKQTFILDICPLGHISSSRGV